jgi:uncharacterized protein YjbJ (UPF0337 family)
MKLSRLGATAVTAIVIAMGVAPAITLTATAARAQDGKVVPSWDRVKGNWNKYAGQVRQEWGKLTDDDIAVINGQRQELVGRLQIRYGLAKEEAEKQVDRWEKTIN